MTYKIGIDPGVTGAIAFLGLSPQDSFIIDMPTEFSGSNRRRRVSAPQLVMELKTYWPITEAVVEDVHAMPRNGSMALFSLGRSLGVVLGVLASAGIPVKMAGARRWKKIAGLEPGADKQQSRSRALELAPHLAGELKRKCDHNRAEAFLIAMFGGK